MSPYHAAEERFRAFCVPIICVGKRSERTATPPASSAGPATSVASRTRTSVESALSVPRQGTTLVVP